MQINRVDQQRIDFMDTGIAFQKMSTGELRRAVFLFSLLRYPWLVNIGKRLILFAMRIRIPVGFIVKPLIFRHFCGGESLEACGKEISALNSFGVKVIPDYSAEGKETEDAFEKVKSEVIRSIGLASTTPGVSFAVFKPTGIAPLRIWEKLSSREPLSEEEQFASQNLEQRLDDIFATSFRAGIPVMVDAEETWIQPAIDNYVRLYSERYNREQTLVYNTIQMYRTDRLDFVKEELMLARSKGYRLGYKIVRGAYHEKEIERAEEMNYPSPVFNRKEDTDAAYDGAILYCFENRSLISFCAATHNEQSTRYLAELLDKAGAKFSKEITFAQLYGMSDNLTFNLAKMGFFAAKYLPYGPLREVIPYLFRRAEENSSVEGQTGRELQYLKIELARRRRVNR